MSITPVAPGTGGGFDGGVFDARVKTGRSSARLRCGVSGLVAEVPAAAVLDAADATDGAAGGEVSHGTLSIDIPYDRLRVERGGASGRMWLCRDSATETVIFSEARGFEVALAAAARGGVQAQVEAIADQGRRRRRLWWSLAGLVAVGLLLAALAVRAMFSAATDAALERIPWSVDEKLGETALEHMDLGGPVVDDPALQAGLDHIVERLGAHLEREGLQLRVRAVRNEQANAFALPGGEMIVLTGLIAFAETPEEVAAVMAHEISHVTARHGLAQLLRSVGIVAAAQLLFGDATGLVALAGEGLTLATLQGYSREAEEEADALAVALLHAARIRPHGLATFFERLEAERGDLPAALSVLSTHPSHAERVAAVRAQVATLEDARYAPLDIDWAAMQRAVTETASEDGG